VVRRARAPVEGCHAARAPGPPVCLRVTLMFNAAGRLQGDFPHLEGKSVKYMYFGNDGDVAERASELADIVRAWIAYKDGGSKRHA
jgi:hypothetical protein